MVFGLRRWWVIRRRLDDAMGSGGRRYTSPAEEKLYITYNIYELGINNKSNKATHMDDQEGNESDDQSNQEILFNSPMITLKIHHGREFKDMHHLEYVGGRIDIKKGVDFDLISTLEIKDIAQNIGCVRINKLAYKDSSCVGLRALETDNDIINMISLVPAHRSIDVYIGHSGYNNEVGVNNQISEEVRKRKVSNASGSCSGSTTTRNASGSSSKTTGNTRVRKEKNQFKPPRVANTSARGLSHGLGTQSSAVLDF
ncbi:hypothetical protein LguiB_033417 [Lonicera macranthoides]